VLRDAGHQVVFATEGAGTLPAADPRLLTGVLFGQLGAAAGARSYYAELTKATEFTATQAWTGLDSAAFDGLLLPGGHAPGMRQYLGSPALRDQVTRFWATGRPVGAICHGVLVLARTGPIPPTSRTRSRPRSTTRAPKSLRGPVTLTARGTATDDTAAFVVQDGNYLSARWPGDAYLFARRFRDLLQPPAQPA
jgi:putative intracellular protease/amidase